MTLSVAVDSLNISIFGPDRLKADIEAMANIMEAGVGTKFAHMSGRNIDIEGEYSQLLLSGRGHTAELTKSDLLLMISIIDKQIPLIGDHGQPTVHEWHAEFVPLYNLARKLEKTIERMD